MLRTEREPRDAIATLLGSSQRLRGATAATDIEAARRLHQKGYPLMLAVRAANQAKDATKDRR